MRLLISDQ